MTWTQMFEADQLPGDVTRAQCEAADRQMRGSRLGPAARRSLRRFQKKLRNEQIIRQREDWDAHDKWLREDGTRTAALLRGTTETGGTPSSAARPGPATSVSTGSRRPAVGGHVELPTAGGALKRSAFDGRTCSPQDLKARLSQLHLDSTWYQVDQATEDARRTREAPSLGLMVKQERARIDGEKRLAEREKQLKAEAIDGRSAPAEAVQARLAKLGIDYDLRTSIRDQGKPLAPPAPPKVPKAQRAAQRRDAEILASAKGTADAMRLSGPEAFRKLLQLRRLSSPTG